MGIEAKRLGAIKPSADTATVLYTVPSSTEAYITVTVVNQSATVTTCRVAHVLTGGTVDWTLDVYAHTVAVDRDAPLVISNIAMDADEDIVVWADDATLSFIASGIERT
jgi:hypothetical protein